MINKTIKYLLIILFLLLPIINSHLFDLLGFKWGFYVNGNYEFTKVIFFNIFSGIILALYFLKVLYLKEKINIPKILFFIVIILILSTIYSSHQFTSLLGNNSKGHSFIMFMNLIGLYILLINSDKKKIQTLLLTTVISSLLVSIIGIKEIIFPTFNYGELSNRALSTFGHPNYLALYLLILIPIINNYININKVFYKKAFFSFVLFISIICLFLTKSVWGIFLFFNYLIYYKKNNINLFLDKINIKKYLKNKTIFYILYLILIIFGILITIKYYPEKLQSFISRFYIWKTTLIIYFSNFKNILLGSGLGTLEFMFDSYKVKELYIFENIGFTADRPHNIIINTLYNFGVFGFIIIVILLVKLKNIYKNTYLNNSIVLFLVFILLNFSSISHYLIIVLILGINIENKYQKNELGQYLNNTLILILIFSGIFGSIFSYKYYQSEYYKINIRKTINTNYFIKKISSENTEYNILREGNIYTVKKCNKLLESNNSAENYLLCGNNLWSTDKKIEAITFYKKGLEKLPDMWNKNSIFYKNNLINKIFVPERFYSTKFSNIKEILKRVGE